MESTSSTDHIVAAPVGEKELGHMVIIGKNGCGKTTYLKSRCPTGGIVTSPEHGTYLSILGAQSGIIESVPGDYIGNCCYYAYMLELTAIVEKSRNGTLSKAWVNSRIQEAIDEAGRILGITVMVAPRIEGSGAKLAQLSTINKGGACAITLGQAEVVSIFHKVAMTQQPRLYIDEPFTHLHPSLQRRAFGALFDLAKKSGTTLCIASHLEEAINETTLPYLYVMREGDAEPRLIGDKIVKGGLDMPILIHRRVLFSDCAVVVEGKNDTLAYGYYFATRKSTVDFSLVEAAGAAGKDTAIHMYNSLRDLGYKAILIMDFDGLIQVAKAVTMGAWKDSAFAKAVTRANQGCKIGWVAIVGVKKVNGPVCPQITAILGDGAPERGFVASLTENGIVILPREYPEVENLILGEKNQKASKKKWDNYFELRDRVESKEAHERIAEILGPAIVRVEKEID